MTQKDAILLAIENAKSSNKILDNKAVISILEATKNIAENGSLIDSLIQLYQTLEEDKTNNLNSLTKREKEILSLIGTGKLTNDIAIHLGLSPSTIETHRKNIRRKLKLNGTGKLFEYALVYNLLYQNQRK